MTNKSRITTAIAAGAILLNSLAPVALAQNVMVTGNGALSDNEVKVETNNTTVVDQYNDAYVTNKVSSDANTGGNSADFNTGGQTMIVTGDATAYTDVATKVNTNHAVLDNCGTCDKGDIDVKIDGNGAYSDNEVKVEKNDLVSITQDNYADIYNNVDAKANTGKNDASFSTGGDVVILTGEAKSLTSVMNKANENHAMIGGMSNASYGGTEVTVSGNGAFSDSKTKVELDSVIVLDQYNSAVIYNDVDAKANTGKNDAAFNTGGETAIVTGQAQTATLVDNDVNFNHASIDCDCVLEDLNIKIAGNGYDSYNKVNTEANNDLFDYQGNFAGIYNDVYGKAKTGYNDVSFSTGDVDGDPLIATGKAWSTTEVSNHGNVNLLDKGVSLHLPGNWEVNAHFDLSYLMSYLHLK